jgi:nitroreductase
MSFSELINRRYSVRAYKPDAVEPERLEQVLDAARLAPTAGNRQAFKVVVMSTKGRQDELRKVYGRDWFTQGPLVLAVCGIPADNWIRKDGRNYNDVDVAIVMDHLVLQAADLGLGTCWIADFDATEARRVLGLPDGVEPVVFSPLGYPADSGGAKKRKAFDDLVCREQWRS